MEEGLAKVVACKVQKSVVLICICCLLSRARRLLCMMWQQMLKSCTNTQATEMSTRTHKHTHTSSNEQIKSAAARASLPHPGAAAAVAATAIKLGVVFYQLPPKAASELSKTAASNKFAACHKSPGCPMLPHAAPCCMPHVI